MFIEKAINILYPFMKNDHYPFPCSILMYLIFTQINEMLDFLLNIGNEFHFHLVSEIKEAFFFGCIVFLLLTH